MSVLGDVRTMGHRYSAINRRHRLLRSKSGTLTMKEAAENILTFFEATTPDWWSISINDGLATERYGHMAYESEKEAVNVADALSVAYRRQGHLCTFVACLRA
ncbi:MAG TPA: hypothetical protein VFA10_18065 [Ktedonobacteraceae bacterium]|nr:hypothetical protein [Ktedonobacteraceae bacterium]